MGPSQIGRPGRFGLSTRLRINRGVIVWALSGFAIFYPLAKALDVVFMIPYYATYRQATFVVQRITTGDDGTTQWAEGVILPGGMKHTHGLQRSPGRGWTLYGDSSVPARPGERMRIWWSDEPDAPKQPVASMLCLPSKREFAFWLAFAAGLFFVGLTMSGRAQMYFGRTEYRTETYFDERR